MANPTISGASFPTLKKTGTSNGTVTGDNFTTGASVSIESKNAKKQWGGTVGSLVSGTQNTYNASVQNTKWNDDPIATDETVNVVVTNSSNQSSNPYPTTSDIP